MPQLYESYLALASNPFYLIDSPINEKMFISFHNSLDKLAETLAND